MIKLLLDNFVGIAGETIKLLILIVTGVVLLDRVKNATRELNTRVGALENWRDDHISSIQPHTDSLPSSGSTAQADKIPLSLYTPQSSRTCLDPIHSRL